MPKRIAWILLLSVSSSHCAATGGPERALALPVGPAQDGHPPERGRERGHGGHARGSQAVNVFVGGSGEVGDLDGLTLGLDYEYRLSDEWGVGGFAEGVSGLDRSFAVGGQVYWHAISELVLVAGPGLERHHDEWQPIARFGAFFEIELAEDWVLSPAIFYDFTEEEDLWLYGLNLGHLW